MSNTSGSSAVEQWVGGAIVMTLFGLVFLGVVGQLVVLYGSFGNEVWFLELPVPADPGTGLKVMGILGTFSLMLSVYLPIEIVWKAGLWQLVIVYVVAIGTALWMGVNGELPYLSAIWRLPVLVLSAAATLGPVLFVVGLAEE